MAVETIRDWLANYAKLEKLTKEVWTSKEVEIKLIELALRASELIEIPRIITKKIKIVVQIICLILTASESLVKKAIKKFRCRWIKKIIVLCSNKTQVESTIIKNHNSCQKCL